MAGFRYINGFPNQAPVHPNISLGDSVTRLTAAFGVVMGLLARNKLFSNSNSITGQVVNVAIYESMFNMMEGILPEYDWFGEVCLTLVNVKKLTKEIKTIPENEPTKAIPEDEPNISFLWRWTYKKNKK